MMGRPVRESLGASGEARCCGSSWVNSGGKVENLGKGLFSRMQQAMVRLYLPLDNWKIVVSTSIWIGGGAYSYRRG